MNESRIKGAHSSKLITFANCELEDLPEMLEGWQLRFGTLRKLVWTGRGRKDEGCVGGGGG